MRHIKKIFSIIILMITLASCKTSSKAVSTTEVKNKHKTIDAIIDNAIDNLGVKYRYAGTNKTGFDCSGLVYTSYGSQDIALPRSSFEQSKIGENIPKNKSQKGDLIFFKTNNSSKINHVGIITEVKSDEIKFIHSSTSKGVIISSTKEAYYSKSFEQINRIIN